MKTLTQNSRRRGGALIASLICVVLVSGLGASLIQMHIASSNLQQQILDNKRAFYIAEAGLAEAFMAVAQGKTGNVASSDIPASFADGVFWVEAEEGPDDVVFLECTGLVGRGRYSLAAILQREVNPVASLGVFGDLDMTVGTGVVLDGYDSRDGTFASQVDASTRMASTGKDARLNGNAEISFASGEPNATRVYGDVAPGPDGAVLADSSVMITGSTAPNTKPSELPSIEVPEFATSGFLRHTDAGAPLVLTGEVHYNALYGSADTEIRLTGPATIVIGSLGLANTANLVFDTTAGPVSLICTDMVKLAPGSNISCTTENPQDAAFLISAEEVSGSVSSDYITSKDGTTAPTETAGGGGPGGMGTVTGGTTSGGETTELEVTKESIEKPVVIRSSGAFHGLIYAPLIDLELPASLRVYGAVSARRIDLAPQARVTFDKGLAAGGIGSVYIPKLESWRIVDLPQVPLVSSRRDPRLTLKLAGVTPVSAPLAHLEKNIDLTYTDTSGAVKSYSGLATSFDWTQVKRVQTKQWEGATLVKGDLMNPAIITEDGAAEKVDTMLAVFGTGMTSAQMRDYLLSQHPLPASVVIRATSSAELSSVDLRQVLSKSLPLSAEEQFALVDEASNLSNADIDGLLTSIGALPDTTVRNLLARTSALPSADLRPILINSSPLSAEVVTFISGGGGGLTAPDLAAVIAAQ